MTLRQFPGKFREFDFFKFENLPSYRITENYEKTTGNPENSIFTGNSKIRFLKFYEKINLLEFTGSDWKFSKSGNNNLGQKYWEVHLTGGVLS